MTFYDKDPLINSKKDCVEVRMTFAVCVHLLDYMFLLRTWNKRPADSSR